MKINIKYYIRNSLIYIIAGLLLASVSSIAYLFIPALAGYAIDDMGDSLRKTAIWNELISIAAIAASATIATYFAHLCANKVALKTVKLMRSQIADKIDRLSIMKLDNISSGSIVNIVLGSCEVISNGIVQVIIQFFTGIITIIATIIIMFTINHFIPIIILALSPLSILLTNFISKKTFITFKQQSSDRNNISELSNEILSNISTIRNYGETKYFQKKFEILNSQMTKSAFLSQFSSAMVNPSVRAVNSIIYIITILSCALFSIKGNDIIGHLTIGSIFTFLFYTQQYAKPFNEISSVNAEIQAMRSSWLRFKSFMFLEENQQINSYDTLDDKETYSISIKDLNFSYDGKNKVLKNINLNIKEGEHIAIVGPTGCGKTTLINLLMRFYDTSEGLIQIDNKSISNIDKNLLRSIFGMVLQDTAIFSDTIKNNVKIAKLDATDEEIVAACIQSHAHEFISKMKDKYDTFISTKDFVLSEGEKQLLAIARIILSNPKILILDEATSNIDTRTERILQDELYKQMQKKTSIIIAHRLSTIKNADRIIVMQDGQIVQSGHHNELIMQEGLYKQLYKRA